MMLTRSLESLYSRLRNTHRKPLQLPRTPMPQMSHQTLPLKKHLTTNHTFEKDHINRRQPTSPQVAPPLSVIEAHKSLVYSFVEILEWK